MKKINWNCLIGKHKWTRIGGAINIGDGLFKIIVKCKMCNKIKELIK
jgi:hypothetical protein